MIGQAMAAYVEPLLQQTDGSGKQIQMAYMFGMLCWIIALRPDAEHEEALAAHRSALKMSDEEFEEFRRGVVGPMIQRHREMFPALNPARRQMIRNGPSLE